MLPDDSVSTTYDFSYKYLDSGCRESIIISCFDLEVILLVNLQVLVLYIKFLLKNIKDIMVLSHCRLSLQNLDMFFVDQFRHSVIWSQFSRTKEPTI